MFERILYRQKLFAASICRYLRIPCLTPRPKELGLSSAPPVSTIHELTSLSFFISFCLPAVLRYSISTDSIFISFHQFIW